MRGGVSVNLSSSSQTHTQKKKKKKKGVIEIGIWVAAKEHNKRTCSRISSDDRPWFCKEEALVSHPDNGLWNALLGRMGQILIIVGSGVDRENLTAGQRNAPTSAS